MKIILARKSSAGFVFFEIIFVAALLLSLFYFAMKVYFKNPIVDKPSQEIISQSGINSTNQKAFLDSTKARINIINKQLLDQEKELENLER